MARCPGRKVKKIALGKSGLFTLVDDADYAALSQFKWHAASCGNPKFPPLRVYAVRSLALPNGKSTTRQMQRDILRLQPGDGKFADHINRNTLDNQRSNLRVVTLQQNLWNRRKARNKSSRYLGVAWHSRRGKWVAIIRHAGRYEELGAFSDEIEAARAWNKKAAEYRGQYARLNEI